MSFRWRYFPAAAAFTHLIDRNSKRKKGSEGGKRGEISNFTERGIVDIATTKNVVYGPDFLRKLRKREKLKETKAIFEIANQTVQATGKMANNSFFPRKIKWRVSVFR